MSPKVGDLQPAAWNPRKISEDQLKRLAKSMAKYGDLGGLIFNIRTRNIVGGHMRVKCFQPDWEIIITRKLKKPDSVGTVAEGHVETPWGRWVYREVDWDEKTEAAANVAANVHGGSFDFAKLREVVSELNDGDLDLDLIGGEDWVEEVVTYDGKGQEPGSGDDSQEEFMVKCPKCSNEFTPRPGKRGA